MKILALSGSLRTQSSNTAILRFLKTLLPEDTVYVLYEGLSALPHFSTDLDGNNPPEAVTDLRRQLRNADAIIICTPEYANGVPGSLKNALDWMVSSGELMHKPTALITASMLGTHAHASLMLTLQMMMAHIPGEATFVILEVSQKLEKETGLVSDPTTLIQLQQALEALQRAVLSNAGNT